jgi:predicted DNA-binding transcriptional regulator AlpA
MDDAIPPLDAAQKPKRKPRTIPAASPGSDMTIPEWCRKHRVSRSMWYRLKDEGRAPRTIKLGVAVRITDEADREWQAAREAESKGEAA